MAEEPDGFAAVIRGKPAPFKTTTIFILTFTLRTSEYLIEQFRRG